jgi:hypothetical protein
MPMILAMANESKPTDADPNVLSVTYPEPDQIFSFHLETLDKVKDGALFVIDTNALLVPYRTGRDSVEAIRKTYAKLVKEKRLVIPAQVAREFANQRAEHLKNTYKQLSDRQSVTINTEPYPLFEGLDEYKALLAAEEEAKKKLDDYRKAVARMLQTMRGWQWNDPISSLYAGLFTKAVIVTPSDAGGKVLEDLEYRYLNKIPPGFKDEKKSDGGIGDLLIWKTILQVGAQAKKHVVFVSGDEKTDWWYRSDKIALYPRFELVDEFRRNSAGKSLHIIPFSRFLELFGASKEVLEEVTREQQAVTPEGRPPSMRAEVEEAVEAWLEPKNENVVRTGDLPHFFTQNGEDLRAVYVYPVALRQRMKQKLQAAVDHAKTNRSRAPMIVLGSRSPGIAGVAVSEASAFANELVGSLRPTIVVGVVRLGTFRPVKTIETRVTP